MAIQGIERKFTIVPPSKPCVKSEGENNGKLIIPDLEYINPALDKVFGPAQSNSNGEKSLPELLKDAWRIYYAWYLSGNANNEEIAGLFNTTTRQVTNIVHKLSGCSGTEDTLQKMTDAVTKIKEEDRKKKRVKKNNMQPVDEKVLIDFRGQGLSRSEIAGKLGKSESNIRSHFSKIIRFNPELRSRSGRKKKT